MLGFMAAVFGSAANDAHDFIGSTLELIQPLTALIRAALRDLLPTDPDIPDAVYLARAGISTWPLGLTSASHILHPFHGAGKLQPYKDALVAARDAVDGTYGYLNAAALAELQPLVGYRGAGKHVWLINNGIPNIPTGIPNDLATCMSFWRQIRARIFEDPIRASPLRAILVDNEYTRHMPNAHHELQAITGNSVIHAGLLAEGLLISSISPQDLRSVTIDMNQALEDGAGVEPIQQTAVKKELDRLQDIELVIVRPNIEHNMLGIIMGQGGESLGSTLWGQTELSVYDDSMHGIWGMSYKYHERAIVFNERNLIRLWDIAYDGYNGGKDDTYVDWMRPNAPNGYKNFQELTMDVSKNYRGPSMMVMAFVHDKAKLGEDGAPTFDKHFRRNWPSPIVFHDTYQKHGAQTKETLPLDYENLQVIDVDEFRVFNNDLYAEPYNQYKTMMPSFHEMHMLRKSAGQSSAEAETHTDSLAFQGSMRIKEGGVVVQDIQGSGHHGPDYIGVASVRAGKGQKVSGQAPTLHRLI
jgi:hypothetical protein